MTLPQFPPPLPYPGDDAPDDVMKRYTERLWLLRQVEREDAATASLAAHRAALETEAARQSAATEEMARVARASLYTEGALTLLADRTSSVTTQSVMVEAIKSSVRDAKSTVDAVLALPV